MQSLASFFEDNKPLAIAALVATTLVLIIVIFLLYRLLFGRRLRAATNGRTRQPRLGIVDAYDLDRQRQLVLVRRDNVEHLIMIGGPTDVVIESSIVRTQAAAAPREKDGAGPLVGTVTPPPAFSPAPAQAALPPAPVPSLPAAARGEPQVAARSEPPMAARSEPTLAPPSARAEPPLGTPMPSPAVERPTPERSPARPIALPDPAAPPVPATAAEAAPSNVRVSPPRPSSLPPRPAPAVGGLQGTGPVVPSAGTVADRAAAPPRPPLPPRPPVSAPPRAPLPPRPSLASSLPPRAPRPLPPRPEPPRGEGEGAAVPAPAVAGGPGAEPEPRVARGAEPAQPRVDPPSPAAGPKNIETLESLEEEMAKLLGRPSPRRDG